MSIGDVDALDQFGRDELAAMQLQNQALAHQRQVEYEEALQLMQESLQLRESSYTTCRSLSGLARLYVDMLKLNEADAICHRMVEESSSPYRYDYKRQLEIADALLDDVISERRHGLYHGMSGELVDLIRSDLNGMQGIVRGRFIDSHG